MNACETRVVGFAHPVGGKPIDLGQDKRAAIQQPLYMNGSGSDSGTVAELWRTYQTMPQ